ncbi:nucleotide exchange factor GrpE [Bradyrhizobium erythrophlei]|uniref:Protein GrpE n=1 Tax=Bradyrhizobium erythrophlei TaxID=1437360 RepID=A0A1M7T5G1_9BRAD|nr:nucleotide exchange factor GrpE [Bradyrhizobium erythrophlei]SHN65961.1 molecular chaperone GrpE [Bradyrhizobium erythrophlei]
MAENIMDNDVNSSASGESNDNDPASEIAALRERLMRALAETENTRRQGERRTQDAQQYAITNFARELLQVVDNLRRALGAAEGDAAKADGLIAGVAATDRVLTQILNRFGVKEVSALNQPFDPGKHEAVMETDQTEQTPGSVVQVLENGYTLHDRLLRPARVVVAKSPQKSRQPAEQ